MSSGASDLYAKAQGFSDNLTHTFRGILTDAPEFSATLKPNGPHVWVTVLDQEKAQKPIVLCIDGKPRLSLRVEFYVCWDRQKNFLAVNKSTVSCMMVERRPEPLFRYEYERGWTSPPAAHLHVHAHRDEASFLLRLGSKGRGGDKAKQESVPRLKEVHFPVGGHRYRPCVEEILWLLVEEFGVDCREGWEDSLRGGILRWREIQLRSAVRDNPKIAAEALEGLKYVVTPPDDGHPPPGSKFSGR